MRLAHSITILLISSLLLFSGCSDNKDSQSVTVEQNHKGMKMEHNTSVHNHYVCPMHPEVLSDHKENCSICGMYLVKQEKQTLTVTKASNSKVLTTKNKDLEEKVSTKKANPYAAYQYRRDKKIFVCPMHPKVTSDHKENCSVCGMYLVEKGSKKSKDEVSKSIKQSPSTQKVNPYAAYQYKRDKKIFVCPMHPEIVSDHKESCSICGMFLEEKQNAEHNKSFLGASQRKLYKLETTCMTFREGSKEHAKRQSQKQEKQEEKIQEQEVSQIKQQTERTPMVEKYRDNKEYYICPMHPEIVSEHKDNCPICGMHLVKQKKQSDSMDGSGVVKLSSSIVQKIGVKTTSVVRGSLKKSLKTAGNVIYNKDRLSEVISKTPGWVENLSLRRAGSHVRRGQLLLELYAPEYLKVQKEFLKAQKIDHSAGRVQKYDQRNETVASRDTLRYLHVPESAINEMIRSGKTRLRIPVYAPQYGEVVRLNVKKHSYVYEDDVMLTIADLSSVWIEVNVFQHQLEWLRRNQEAEIVVDILPGKRLRGRVDAISPELDPRTHTVNVRVLVANPDYVLRPNMYAQVTIFDNSEKDILKIPRGALIATGDRTSVIKALGNGLFMPVDVVAGLQSGGEVEIRSGLDEGDLVVTSGQFLIDSEANLRASFRRFEDAK